jgi:thiol-disulfide isomerase/thioredoxin
MKMKMKGGSRKMNGGCVDSVVAGILLAIIVIAVAVGVYYYYKKHHQPTPTPSMTGGMMEHFASGDIDLTPKGDETVVALYWAEWCGHCKTYKPD